VCHGSRSRGHMTMALDTLMREAGHTTRRDTAGCWATPPPRHHWHSGSTQWVSLRARCDLTHKHNCHFWLTCSGVSDLQVSTEDSWHNE